MRTEWVNQWLVKPYYHCYSIPLSISGEYGTPCPSAQRKNVLVSRVRLGHLTVYCSPCQVVYLGLWMRISVFWAQSFVVSDRVKLSICKRIKLQDQVTLGGLRGTGQPSISQYLTTLLPDPTHGTAAHFCDVWEIHRLIQIYLSSTIIESIYIYLFVSTDIQSLSKKWKQMWKLFLD